MTLTPLQVHAFVSFRLYLPWVFMSCWQDHCPPLKCHQFVVLAEWTSTSRLNPSLCRWHILYDMLSKWGDINFGISIWFCYVLMFHLGLSWSCLKIPLQNKGKYECQLLDWRSEELFEPQDDEESLSSANSFGNFTLHGVWKAAFHMWDKSLSSYLCRERLGNYDKDRLHPVTTLQLQLHRLS